MRFRLLILLGMLAMAACSSNPKQESSDQDMVDYEVADDTEAIEEIVEEGEDIREARLEAQDEELEELEEDLEPDPENYSADNSIDEEFSDEDEIIEAEQVWQPERKRATRVVRQETTVVKEASLVQPTELPQAAPSRVYPQPQPQRRQVSRFKNGYYLVSKDCNMRLRPSSRGYKDGILKKGRTVWAENQNSSWVRVYRKGGRTAYVYKGCL